MTPDPSDSTLPVRGPDPGAPPDPLPIVRGPEPAARPPEPQSPAIWLDRGPALPADYGIDRLVALVRDPRTLLVYWRCDEPRWRLAAAVGTAATVTPAPPPPAPVLRVFAPDSGLAHELPVLHGAHSAYVDVAPDMRWMTELGFRDPAGAWQTVLRSNEVRTPPAGPSPVVDPEWSVTPEEYSHLVALLDSAVPSRYRRSEPAP